MIYILAGPSGSGKTTQANILSKRDDFKRIITCTTRPMRDGEVDGLDYYFKTKEEFQSLLEQKKLIAVTEYSGNLYGVPKQSLEKYINSKTEHIVMVLDLNGVRELKELGAYCICLTLDAETLRERMIERGDNMCDVIARLNDGLGLVNYCDFFIDSRRPIEFNANEISKFIELTCK
ncbi:guanylate kinase [Peptoniphilus asaccharolyticus]